MVAGKHLDLLRMGAAAVENWQLMHRNEHLDLSWSALEESDFSNFDLSNADFSHSDLYFCNFSHANLKSARLVFCELAFTKFNNANLTYADLSYSSMRDPTLSDADFSGVDLTYTVICSPQITGNAISLERAKLSNTIFVDCDFTAFKNFESTAFLSRCSVDLLTLLNTYSASKNFDDDLRPFLLSIGVSKSMLDALPEIWHRDEYYSCFVSYGEPDKAFAEELVRKLKTAGVQAWIYSLDSEPGRRIWAEISERRMKHDKMIIICSAQSLIRPGVKKELEEQIDDDCEKMIPISLDHIWNQRGFLILREDRDLKPYLIDRTYADFSERAAYDRAFAKLLKALKKRV